MEWFANYKDGTLHQYNSENYNIAHIDTDKLDTLVFQKEADSITPALIVHFDDPRKEPIFVIRNEPPNAIRPFHTRCYIVGWKMKIGKEIVQSVNYIMETIGRTTERYLDEKETNVSVPNDLVWIETASKFDRNRNSWFQKPSDKNLSIIGSKCST